MTTLTLDLLLEAAPPDGGAGIPEERGAARGSPRGVEPPAAEGRGRLTLDDVVVGVWEGLTAHHAVGCPVCGGEMRPRYGSSSAPVGGRCTGCGSTLG